MKTALLTVVTTLSCTGMMIAVSLAWLYGTSPRFEARCRLLAYRGLRQDERERQLLRALALVERELAS